MLYLSTLAHFPPNSTTERQYFRLVRRNKRHRIAMVAALVASASVRVPYACQSNRRRNEMPPPATTTHHHRRPRRHRHINLGQPKQQN